MEPASRPSTIVRSVDVDDPCVDHVVGDARHERARLLVWRGDAPAGVVDVGLPVTDRAELLGRVAVVGNDHRPGPGIAGSTDSATVVVATHDRPESLVRCLRALLDADAQDFAVIVVDNAPSDDGALTALRANFGGSRRIRYLVEERPGLAAAHNATLPHIETDYVLFTDDDVLVDRRWVRSMVSAFERDGAVACVTGLIMPAELETETQWLIEESVGFTKGFERRRFDLGAHRPPDPLFPLTAGSLGSGANMGFRTDFLREIGGFDAALGAGSRGGGGDDLASFIDVVEAGRQLVYEPSAVVFHPHHRSPEAALAMAHGYGKGLSAAMVSSLVRHPRLLGLLLRRLPGVAAHAVSATSPKNRRRPPAYPRSFVRAEFRGMAVGPFAYALSRWSVSRYRRSGKVPPAPLDLSDEVGQ